MYHKDRVEDSRWQGKYHCKLETAVNSKTEDSKTEDSVFELSAVSSSYDSYNFDFFIFIYFFIYEYICLMNLYINSGVPKFQMSE